MMKSDVLFNFLTGQDFHYFLPSFASSFGQSLKEILANSTKKEKKIEMFCISLIAVCCH